MPRVKVEFEFDRPVDETMALIMRDMCMALPKGVGRIRLRIEGCSPEYGAAFEAAMAVGRAQQRVKAARRST